MEKIKINGLKNTSKYMKKSKNKIISNLRRRLRYALHGKPKLDTSKRLIGCSWEILKNHLESKWLPGMTWENYGRYKRNGEQKWHVDHIIPCSKFNLSKEEEQRKCFHFSNLQPLWAIDNIKKGDKFIPDWSDYNI